jgi:hypothetical protein
MDVSTPEGKMEHASHAAHGGGMIRNRGMYRRLLIMVVISFVAMYILMYAMVNSFANALSGLNQAYMAALMTAAMVIIELGVMWNMYANRRRNVMFMVAAVVALGTAWVGIRQQLAIGNRQFLRSMIPHHAGAILMCQQASIDDARIRQLCSGIVESQSSEITQMRDMMRDAK